MSDVVVLLFCSKNFGYTTEVSAIEIKLKPGESISGVISRLKEVLGENYTVKDRMMQQEDSFRMMQIEKWMTFLILAFILVIATFNVIAHCQC